MCYYEKKEVALWNEELAKTRAESLIYPCIVSLLHKAQAAYDTNMAFIESNTDDFMRRLCELRLIHRMNWIQIAIVTGIDDHNARNMFCRYKKRYERRHGVKLNTIVI